MGVLSRRLVFAAPFVITACDRPVHHEPRPRRVKHADDTPRPDAVLPEELVDDLPRLTARPADDGCHDAASTSLPRDYPPEIRAETTRVWRIVREQAGARVRGSHDQRCVDGSWRAVFVDDHAVEHGACEIVGWENGRFECVTMLAPEQLVSAGETLRVKLVPPQAVVDANEAQQRRWRFAHPTNSNPPRPKPRPEPTSTAKPPAPLHARVIGIQVTDVGTELLVGRGRDAGVDEQWRVQLVLGVKPLAGGDCKIVQVTLRTTRCRVRMTPDQVTAAGRTVVLSPR